MTQSPLFNPRPAPAKLFTPGTQSYLLYERLLRGEVTNSEIVRQMNIFNSTGRISDIRAKIKPYLLDIEATRINKGLFSYKLKGGLCA
jgi:hypothetical protein